jgi:hypothetical protein
MEPASPPSTVSHDTRPGGTPGTPQVGALRRALHDDPNDERAFTDLVSLLQGSPATGPASARDLAWSLAEELAQYPQAWFPLLELARLSLADPAAALQRIQVAIRRDPSGMALTRAVPLLAAAGHPGDAFQLAIAHWRPATHGLATGRHLVRAALASGRTQELRRYLRALVPTHRRVAWVLRAELETRRATHHPAPWGTARY